MSRKLARESVYKLVFEFLFLNESNQRTFDILSSIDLAEGDRKYMERAYFGVIQKNEELIELISNLSEGFSLERIFKPDLAALMLAIYEMRYMDDIPLSVSIAEAVELAKRYSTEKSNQYVNGVLSTVYKTITEQKEIAVDDNY